MTAPKNIEDSNNRKSCTDCYIIAPFTANLSLIIAHFLTLAFSILVAIFFVVKNTLSSSFCFIWKVAAGAQNRYLHEFIYLQKKRVLHQYIVANIYLYIFPNRHLWYRSQWSGEAGLYKASLIWPHIGGRGGGGISEIIRLCHDTNWPQYVIKQRWRDK